MRAARLVWMALLVGGASVGCAVKDGCEVTSHCLEDLVCDEGSCVPTDNGACVPRGDDSDGCDAWHVCGDASSFGQDAVFRCLEAPTCTGAPPPAGGFCNQGDWAEKADGVFLPGRCRTAEDCDGERCAFPDGARLGYCTGGFDGQLCTASGDCNVGGCTPGEGVLGVCRL